MPSNLIPIPRVESRAPNKNTMEWEIPNKVLATLMLIGGIGYMFLVKVKQDKKHWWNKSWKTFSTKAADPATAVLTGLDFLEKHGYTIDHNSIEFGEKVGDPEYFQQTPDEDERITFFETHVKNAHLIREADGILPIRPHHIGQIVLNKRDKTATIEIKQCAEPQIIAYFTGHLLCRNVEYRRGETTINGAVFTFQRDTNQPGLFKLQLNNNRQGVEIICAEVELTNYREVRLPIEEYKDVYVGCLWGKFFSISERDA